MALYRWSMDKEYWDQFYSKKQVNGLDMPTSFAQFCLAHIPNNSTVIDVGCGNGRDSLFFATHGHSVIAVDQSEAAIASISQLGHAAISTVCNDVANVAPLAAQAVYSRFFLHAIPEEHEEQVLDWVSLSLPKGGKLFLEVRSDRYGGNYHYGNDHYRRPINFNALQQKLLKRGFKITFSIESNGLAMYKDEDPQVIRIIAEKE